MRQLGRPIEGNKATVFWVFMVPDATHDLDLEVIEDEEVEGVDHHGLEFFVGREGVADLK